MSRKSRRQRKGQPKATPRRKQPPAPKARPQQQATREQEPDVEDQYEAPRASRRSAREESRQQRAEEDQRKRWLRLGGGIVVAVVLIGILWGGYRWYMGPDVSGDVETYFSNDMFVAVHPENDTVILYEQIPPVGGPHNTIWQNCGYYDEYIYNWHGVHSLEHGAVWLTYDPSLSEADRAVLEDKVGQGYVLVSPYPGLDAPVVGSVWGKQIEFDGVNDERIDSFIRQYRLNPDNTPEQNARCSGGVSLTTQEEPQQTPYQRADQDGPPIGGLTSVEATATAQAPASTPAASSSPEDASDEDAASGSE